MGNVAARKINHEAEVVNEDELHKAIDELESLAKAGGDAPITAGHMRNTKEARGGGSSYRSPAGQPTSLAAENEDAAHFDMTADEGSGAERGASDKAHKAFPPKDDDSESEPSDDASEDSDESDSSEDEEMSTKGYKSLRENDTIRKAVEVSSFLSEITDALGNSLDGLRKSIDDRDVQNRQLFGAFRKALVAVGNEVVGLREEIAGLSNSPRTTRKSMLTKSDVSDREFGNEEGAAGDDEGGKGAAEVSKSDVSNYVCELVEKGEIPPSVAIEFEQTNNLPGPVAAKVREHFSAQN